MGKYIPYRRAKNYAKHRCHRAIVAFDRNDVSNEYTAIYSVEEYLRDVHGTWTAEWNSSKNELTVYAKDKETLSYVSMLSV